MAILCVVEALVIIVYYLFVDN